LSALHAGVDASSAHANKKILRMTTLRNWWLWRLYYAGLRILRRHVYIVGTRSSRDRYIELLWARATPYRIRVTTAVGALELGDLLGIVARGQPRQLP